MTESWLATAVVRVSRGRSDPSEFVESNMPEARQHER